MSTYRVPNFFWRRIDPGFTAETGYSHEYRIEKQRIYTCLPILGYMAGDM